MPGHHDANLDPVDPDVEMSASEARTIPPVTGWQVVAVVAAGGAAGALARYGVGLIWPTPPLRFPWATLLVNTVGCLLIGVVVVLVTDHGRGHPLLRPGLGTGVLGGFTTFSTYAVDLHRLAAGGERASAVGYLIGTVLLALTAAWVGIAVTRAFSRPVD